MTAAPSCTKLGRRTCDSFYTGLQLGYADAETDGGSKADKVPTVSTLGYNYDFVVCTGGELTMTQNRNYRSLPTLQAPQSVLLMASLLVAENQRRLRHWQKKPLWVLRNRGYARADTSMGDETFLLTVSAWTTKFTRAIQCRCRTARAQVR